MERFSNPWKHEAHTVWSILRWKLRLGHQEAPTLPDAPQSPARVRTLTRADIATLPADGWRVTWLGHASFLLQGAGQSILIDPVFSTHCFPFPLPPLRRLIPPPCRVEDLPPITAILITHSHYDHLDWATVRQFSPDTQVVCAQGHSAWFKNRGFKNAVELPWHVHTDCIPGLRVTATPGQHFTARTPLDKNRGHWCGFLIEGAGCKLWHAGDSGWCGAFHELGERHGPLDFGMIPIGAYLPRRIMKAMHMDPHEAVEAFLATRCRRAVAMHWGTFRLTDEPMGEPSILLDRSLRERQLPLDGFVAGEVGGQWEVLPYFKYWSTPSVPGVQ